MALGFSRRRHGRILVLTWQPRSSLPRASGCEARSAATARRGGGGCRSPFGAPSSAESAAGFRALPSVESAYDVNSLGRSHLAPPDSTSSLSGSGGACRAAAEQQLRPLLFVHGVGAGVVPYMGLLFKLWARCAMEGRALLVPEMRSLSMRFDLSPHPSADDIADDLLTLLEDMGADKADIVGHSFGTFIGSIVSRKQPEKVASMTLIDPVCFLVFVPKLIKSFVYRPFWSDRVTSFASAIRMFLVAHEMGISATMCRRFAWTSMNMWLDHVPEKMLVVLSGNDDLIPYSQVKAFLGLLSTCQVMEHEDLEHAGILGDFVWQERVLDRIMSMVTRTSDDGEETSAAAARWL